MADRTMVEAVRLALEQEMGRDDDVVLLGEDVGVDGGVFRVTEGLLERFGEQRVVDTPLAESAILGMAIGMAIAGMRPVCEMQFSGFSYLALHQLESYAARMRWRSRGSFHVPLVVRMPFGAGVRALEHHSESREAYFAHTPGLKVVVPSGPRAARALLVSAIRDPDPVVLLENKAIYRAFREEVPDEEESMSIGRSRTVREGDDLTMVSYGAMLRRTMEAAAKLSDEDGVEAEVVDLCALAPMDTSPVIASVRRTGRAVVVNEAPRTLGVASEVVARITDAAFFSLEAPVRRVTGPDVPVPYFAREQAYLPSVARIVAASRATLESEA